MGVIVHEATREYVLPLDRRKLAVRLRTTRELTKSCTVLFWNRNKADRASATSLKMNCYARDNTFDYYEGIIETEAATRYLLYFFLLELKSGERWLSVHGLKSVQPDSGFFEYCYTNERDVFVVPEWAKHAVVYQIFPDRYDNGDPSNDPKETRPWGSEPTREHFMGGDLQGILKRLNHISGLGAEVLYLNPIFLSPSNHKYDTEDYFKIDPAFGTADDLKALVDTCHQRGIRVLLDGVFNHCGFQFPPFQDVLKHGEQSVYREWFYFDGFPVDPEKLNYETIGYYSLMPKLRLSHNEVREFILKVAMYWLGEAGIDGWRIDVAEEIDYTFLQELRRTVKSEYPDCFLLAETWKENRDMLRGDQMDSVINYPLRDAVMEFFVETRIDSHQFDSRLNRLLGVYPGRVQPVLFNPLGSHDTPRLLTSCNEQKERVKVSAAFQFCFPGMPVIYYGDEIGLSGGPDPGCRKAMVWESEGQDMELLEWYKLLIRTRVAYPALREGSFISNYCKPGGSIYAFIREIVNGSQRVYCVFNRNSNRESLLLPVAESSEEATGLRDLLSGNIFPIRPMVRGSYVNEDRISYRGVIQIQMEAFQVCLLSAI